MQIYLAQNGQQHGPYPEARIRGMLAAGEITTGDMCWMEGMPAWQPLQSVLGAPAAHSVPLQAGVANASEPAGFWVRVAAVLIDAIVCGIVGNVVGFVIGLSLGMAGVETGVIQAISQLVSFVLNLGYFAVMESSPRQATIGKMALGLKVVSLDGQRISLLRAAGRYLGKLLSVFILFIGFVMCAFTKRKQCLHDMLASCLVVRSK